MLFTKLKLNYFGRFRDREIELKPGINLIYGENEAGKSTIHTFIRGMLFGIERLRGRGSASKEDLYTRYLPWEYPGAFSGSMDIRLEGKEYRLQRSFLTNDKYFTILDLSTGREVKPKDGQISDMVPGLTESAFKNTISIEQLKAQTDTALSAEVRNYITNLSIAKSKEVDVAKAVSILTEQRKHLEAILNTRELEGLQAEIEEGLAKEERINNFSVQLRDLLKEEQRIAEQRNQVSESMDNEAAKKMEQLPAILEKYHSYKELLKQGKSLDAQSRELEAKIAVWENEKQDGLLLKKDASEIQKLQAVLPELEKQNIALHNEKEGFLREKRKNLLISLLPAFAAALAVLLITGFKPAGFLISAVLVIAGTAGYAALIRKSREKQRMLADRKITLDGQREALESRMNDILTKHGVTRTEGLSIKLEEALRNSYALEHSKEQKKDINKRKADLEDNRDTIYETIMKYMQYFVTEEELTDTSIQRLQEIIAARKQETTGKIDEINRQHENCKLKIEKLKWEIAALEGNEEILLKNKEKYKELEQMQKEASFRLEAVKLALSSIHELSADIHDSFGQQLNSAVSEVISEVTGRRYTDLKIDEKLEVKIGWKGDYVLLDRLSAGTIDQVYFALRMAVADLLLGKNNVPLLLDDSFALYDDNRVLAALSKLGERNQVILFTCHKREQKLLKETGLPFHFVDLSAS